ncbi:MAG: hypothetical protein IT371_00600 [Deltaproteobacteria bacterium]|nr:hypothetical protein [Deltaproteobacteria bacterium]
MTDAEGRGAKEGHEGHAPGEDRDERGSADEALVMTYPHLLLRELLAVLAATLVLVLVSIYVDAPLEQVANHEKTPNPAKAPWYFLGLQELLHYYPPVVSGVILPGLYLVALAVIPYVRMNNERPPLWEERRGRRLAWLWIAVAAGTAVMALTGAHPAWPLIGPLWAVALLMTLAAFCRAGGGARGWLRRQSLAFWIFGWSVLAVVVLTVVGVYFRGPGWRFTLPWRDGVFY